MLSSLHFNNTVIPDFIVLGVILIVTIYIATIKNEHTSAMKYKVRSGAVLITIIVFILFFWEPLFKKLRNTEFQEESEIYSLHNSEKLPAHGLVEDVYGLKVSENSINHEKEQNENLEIDYAVLQALSIELAQSSEN